MSTAVSYLFVPASRPERFAKALASGADEVIIDLEDAVAAEDKDPALTHLIEALEAPESLGAGVAVHVRVNAPDSSWFDRDLAALAGLSASAARHLAGVVIPKAEDPAVLRRVHELLGEGVSVIALVESAVGVSRLREMAAVTGLTRFALGAADLSFDLDVSIESATIDWVYAALVLESRLAGLPGPIASPAFSITDLDVVEADARSLRGMGAAGQLCIHPVQLPAVHRGFCPSEAETQWAARVVAAEGDGAAQLDGQMIDKPVRERAERILSRVKT